MGSGASRATRDVRRAPMSRVGRASREGRDPGILARCRVLDPRKQRPGSDGGRARVSVDAPPPSTATVAPQPGRTNTPMVHKLGTNGIPEEGKQDGR